MKEQLPNPETSTTDFAQRITELEILNMDLGEVDHETVNTTLDELIGEKMNREWDTVEVNKKLKYADEARANIDSFITDVVNWTNYVGDQMLGSEDQAVAESYLDSQKREEVFEQAHAAVEGAIDNAMVQIGSGRRQQTLNQMEKEAIEAAAAAITDALQIRHEIRDVTHRTITTVLAGFIDMARAKHIAINRMTASPYASLQQAEAQINRDIFFAVRNSGYVQALSDYMEAAA